MKFKHHTEAVLISAILATVIITGNCQPSATDAAVLFFSITLTVYLVIRVAWWMWKY